MLGRALKEVRLPFPDDFFPEIVVPTEDDDMYTGAAQTKVHETLKAEFPATRFHPAQRTDQWKLVGDRQGVQLYRERGVAQGNAVQVICVGSLLGSFEDVMWGLYAATTPAFKTQRSILHADYLDAHVLHVLDAEDCGEDDTAFSYRFSGIKWLATAPSGKLTMHKRDLCWHETMGLVHDANGDEVGYLTMQSVRINECPSFDQFGVVRSSANVCYIFRKLANGSVGVYMKGEHSVGGKSRSWGSDSIIVEMWLAITNVLDCAHAKRLTRMLRGKDLFCATQSKVCEICDQKVRSLKSAENCKICGKNVCEKCRMTKPIYPTKNVTTFPCLETFCKRCLSDVKDMTFAHNARLSYHSDNASSHGSGSSMYRAASNRSGGYSMYSLQSAPVRPGSALNGSGIRYPPQHYSEGNVRFSPTGSASSRGGRSFASSDYSNHSMDSSAHYRQPSQTRGPVSLPPREQMPPFRRDVPPQQGRYYPSSSTASTNDVDFLESSFDGRVRLSSDPSVSEMSDGASHVEVSTRQARAKTAGIVSHSYSTSEDGLGDDHDIHGVIEVHNRVAPEPTEPVDVFHEDKLKYINSFSADASGNLANPTLGGAGGSAAMDEHQRLMERLLQANMAAEATYLLAKYSNNLAKGEP